MIMRFFDPVIAVTSITFFIVGDIMAPLGKNIFLPIKFIGEKTIGGALLIFSFAIVAGIFLNSLTPLVLSWKLIVNGALTAAILDQFSFLLDDNLLVPIGTAVILSLIT